MARAVHSPLSTAVRVPSVRTRHRASRHCPAAVGAPEAVVEEETLAALSQRLEDAGMVNNGVRVETVSEGDRGLVAAQKLDKGQLVLKVPSKMVLNRPAALAGTALRGRLEKLPTWTILAVVVAQLRTRAVGFDLPARDDSGSKADGAASNAACGVTGEAWDTFGAYVALLPAVTRGALEWSEDELESAAATSAIAEVDSLRESADSSWREVSVALEAAVAAGEIAEGVVTEARFRWGLSMLLSRLVRLGPFPDDEALVPYADFLNHSSSRGVYVRWNWNRSNAFFKTDRNYVEDQQVFVSYGEKSSADLLLSYGFLAPRGANPYDACIVQLQLDPEDPFYNQKAEVLRELTIPPVQRFPMRRQGWPTLLLPFAAFVACAPEDATDLRPLGKILFQDGQFPVLDDEDTEVLAREFMCALLSNMRAERKAMQEADTELAEAIAEGPGSPNYVLAALATIRLEEASILSTVMRQVALDSMTDGATLAQEAERLQNEANGNKKP